jgi:hypothetical protein
MTTACRLVQCGAILLGTAILASLFATPSVSASAPWIATGLAGCGLVLTAIMDSPAAALDAKTNHIHGCCALRLPVCGGVLTIDWPEYKYALALASVPAYALAEQARNPRPGRRTPTNQIGGVWASRDAFCTAVWPRFPRSAGDTTGSRKPILCAPLVSCSHRRLPCLSLRIRAALAALAVAILCALVICSRRWLLLVVPGIAASVWLSSTHHRLIPSLAQLLLHDEGATTRQSRGLISGGSALRAFEDPPPHGDWAWSIQQCSTGAISVQQLLA